MAVLCENQVFILNVFDEDGVTVLDEAILLAAIEDIKKHAEGVAMATDKSSVAKQRPIGALTAQNRNV